MLASVLFSILLSSTSYNVSDYSCIDELSTHPVRNEYMLQIVLKSYNYYEGKIDGKIGSVSKAALRSFQNKNGLIADGTLGPQTCLRFLDRANISRNATNINNDDTNKIMQYSEEVESQQIILKELGIYTGTVDGLNGPGTKRAIKDFQNRAGLVADGVVGDGQGTSLRLFAMNFNYVGSGGDYSNDPNLAIQANEIISSKFFCIQFYTLTTVKISPRDSILFGIIKHF